MPHQDCTEIRSNVMLFIDNELLADKRADLIKHFDSCEDCKKYYDSEQELKEKICLKIKDSYICDIDESKLKSSIKDIISNEIN